MSVVCTHGFQSIFPDNIHDCLIVQDAGTTSKVAFQLHDGRLANDFPVMVTKTLLLMKFSCGSCNLHGNVYQPIKEKTHNYTNSTTAKIFL